MIFYINQAKELNITPILITPVEARVKDEKGEQRLTRGGFPSYIKELWLSDIFRATPNHLKIAINQENSKE